MNYFTEQSNWLELASDDTEPTWTVHHSIGYSKCFCNIRSLFVSVLLFRLVIYLPLTCNSKSAFSMLCHVIYRLNQCVGSRRAFLVRVIASIWSLHMDSSPRNPGDWTCQLPSEYTWRYDKSLSALDARWCGWQLWNCSSANLWLQQWYGTYRPSFWDMAR